MDCLEICTDMITRGWIVLIRWSPDLSSSIMSTLTFLFFSFSLTCLDNHSIDCHDIFAWKKRMVDPEAGFSVCNSPSPSWDDPHDINGGYFFFSDSTSCCCEPSSASDAKQTYVQGFFVVVENPWTNPLICYYAGRSICVFVIYG